MFMAERNNIDATTSKHTNSWSPCSPSDCFWYFQSSINDIPQKFTLWWPTQMRQFITTFTWNCQRWLILIRETVRHTFWNLSGTYMVRKKQDGYEIDTGPRRYSPLDLNNQPSPSASYIKVAPYLPDMLMVSYLPAPTKGRYIKWSRNFNQKG